MPMHLQEEIGDQIMTIASSSLTISPESGPGRLAGRLGLAGGWVSIACPIHCVLTPVMATSLPFLRKGPFGEALEVGLMGVTVALGVVGVGFGYWAHRSCRVPAVLAAGIVLLVLGRLAEDAGSSRLGTVLVVAGGIISAFSHLLNRRCCSMYQRSVRAAGSSEGGVDPRDLGAVAP
jgi:hypothetical protein